MFEEEKITALERIKRCDERYLSHLTEAKKNRYKNYFATLILSSEEIVQRSKIEWEYKSLTHLIEEEFVMHRSADLWFSEYDGKKAEDTWHRSAICSFSDILQRKLLDADGEGLIFYVKEENGFRLAQPTDGPYNFFLQLAIDDAIGSQQPSSPPSWLDKLFVNAKNLYAHKLLWCRADTDEPELKKAKYDAALRETRRLGVNLPSVSITETEVSVKRWPWGSHTTLNLEHLEAAAKKFWMNYDSSDQTTASTNATVAKWLHDERGVSKSLSEAMASILRDEKLPTGPRK